MSDAPLRNGAKNLKRAWLGWNAVARMRDAQPPRGVIANTSGISAKMDANIALAKTETVAWMTADTSLHFAYSTQKHIRGLRSDLSPLDLGTYGRHAVHVIFSQTRVGWEDY